MESMKADKELEEALERFALAHEAESDERALMVDDLRFAALDQWPDNLKRLREQDPNGARPCLVLDLFGQYQRQVINDTRANLPSIRVRPVDDKSDKETAEVMNGIIRHIEDESSADIAYLNALTWAVRCGLGYFRILTEYVSDDSWNQRIRIAQVHNRFGVYRDPFSTAPDGSDFEWLFITDDVPRKTFEKTHPKAEQPSDFASGSEGDLQRTWFGEETVRLAEYFRIVREKDEVVLLEDQSSMYGSRYEEMLAGGADQGPDRLPLVIRRRPVDRRVCQWQKMSGCEVLEESEFPSSYIPVIPVIGTEYWIDGKRHLSGMVRPAKDPQRGFNYNMSVATEISGLGPRAPFIGAAGQFEGYEDKWGNANTENYAYLEYNPIALGGTLSPPPQRQQFTGAPSAMLQMAQLFQGNVQAVLGMYSASVGAPGKEKTGIALREQKQEGDVGNLHYRANLALSMRHGGRILLEMIPRVIDTAQVARIIGEDGSVDTVALDPALDGASQKTPKGQPNIHNITIGKYDLSMDIGPAYATRRQDSAQAMVEMVRANPQLMQVAGDLVVRTMDFVGAEQLADRLKKALPAELADDEDGAEPQIPPKIKAQIQQGMQQYEQQLAQAQQMIQGLQQQLGEASAAAQEGQAAAKDKGAEHDIKWQELQLKDFEAQTKRQELQLRAKEIEARIEQIDAQTAQTQAGTLEMNGVNETLAGLIQAQQGMEAALADLAQLRAEQIAAEEHQAEVNEAIGGMLQSLQAPKRIQLVRDEQERPEGFVVHQDGQPPRQGTFLHDDDGRLAGAE
jgi:hypothetical protein